jgi:chromosome segregation ATPase
MGLWEWERGADQDDHHVSTVELRQDKAMLQGALDAANEQVARLSRDYEAAQQVKRDALAEVKRLRADRASYSQRYEVLETEVKRLRGMEEPLRTLYRFVMESWYARNIAVPSGVLERAYRATGLLLP